MLIIKGAIYKCGDELVRPHFTADTWMVDCDVYCTYDGMKEKGWGEQGSDRVKAEGSSITHDGETYYHLDHYEPLHTKDFELLSDLSELEFFDGTTEF